MTSDPDIVYMGCYLQSGHYAWLSGMQKTYDNKYNAMDSKEYPGFYKKNDRSYYLPEGKARVVNKTGWTWLSWNDYTFDDRIGSHCVFLMKGTKTFAEALEFAKENYTPLFEKLPYEVTEWEEDD